MTIHHEFYPSVSALRTAIQTRTWRKKQHGDRVKAYLTSARDKWLGIEGGALAALAALVDGYPAGEQMIREFHSSITASLPRAVGVNRAIRRGPMGDELDIHAVNRGNVDRAWSSSVRVLKRGNSLLRLVVDIAAPSDTSAATMQWRGVAGLALSEVMSKAGYSVEIVAAFSVHRYETIPCNDQMTCSVVVKPRSIQADLGLLASTVALPAFFRTLGLCAIILCADKQNKSAHSALGEYLDVSGVLPVPEKITQLIVPQDVTSKESAVEWVRNTVALLQGASA